MKKMALIGATLLALSGCSYFGGTGEPAAPAAGPSKEVVEAITAAEAAQKASAAVKGEWRDVSKFIKEAQEAAKAGDNDKALKLAKKARFEAEAGAKQAQEQAKAGPWLF